MPPAHGNGHGNGSGNGHGRPALLSAALADRLPPQNLEAEQGVLGSILLDNEVLHDIIPVLKAEHFYRDSHQILYRAIRDLYDQAKALDSITLEEELRSVATSSGEGRRARHNPPDPRQRAARSQCALLRANRS